MSQPLGPRRSATRWSRAALAIVLAGAVLVALPDASRAEQASISITGTPTVSRGLHGSFRISGTALAPDRGSFPDNEVRVVGVPAAEPCESSPVQRGIDSKLGFEAQVHGPAPFEFTWEPPVEDYVEIGAYTLCATLYGKEMAYVAGAQMTMNVVKPEFRMKEIVPHHVRIGQRAKFAVRGWLQAPAYLETQIVPSRILVCGAETCHFKKIRECASTPEAEEKLIDESESVSYPFYGEGTAEKRLPAGSFSFSRRLRAHSAGLFRMCSWLTEQGENENPAMLFVSARWRVTG